MEERTYTIGELAKLAGVTIRTIRYYVSQGLLPSPGMAGQSDRYDESYLHRLQLIKRLKAEYLPLEKIRILLDSLGEDAIKEEVKDAPPPAADAETAREYLQSVLHPEAPLNLNQRLINRFERTDNEPAAYFRSPSVLYNREPVRQEMLNSVAVQQPETWVRYAICDGVELNVREQPANPEIKRRLSWILKQLERLCSNNP